VAGREVAFLAALHAEACPLPACREFRLRCLRRGLPVVGHEGALARGLLLLAGRRGASFADGCGIRLGGLRGDVVGRAVLRHGASSLVGSFKITRMAQSDPSPLSASTPRADELREAVTAGLPAAIADLSGLVRIPSVSWDGFDFAHVHASAERVAELARELGVFETVDVVQLPVSDPDSDALGQPAVVATRAARDGKPTILLYAHHDVQPPGDEAHWDSKPFEPTLRGDRLYGRGAADDKAGIIAHLAAIRAHQQVLGGPELGLVLYIEGEEEFGSRSILTFLEHYRETFDADVIVVADSGNWSTEIPAITVGLRGAVAFNLRVTTLAHASHSGMFGGAVPDAMLAAVRMLDSLWNADGSVAVEGLTSREADTPPYDEAQLRAET